MKIEKRQIRIRCVESSGEGLLFTVEQESDAAIHIDNHAKHPAFHTACTLTKLPDGRLANSTGQQYEIIPLPKMAERLGREAKAAKLAAVLAEGQFSLEEITSMTTKEWEMAARLAGVGRRKGESYTVSQQTRLLVVDMMTDISKLRKETA